MPEQHAPQRNLFPWTTTDAVSLHVDGVSYLAQMLTDIERARQEILFEMYLVKSGQVAQRFVTALAQAARRGVQVYILLDGFGCREFNEHDRQALRDAGARVELYRPLQLGQWRNNFARDHRKLLIVDGDTAWTGGTGIADEFDAQLHAELAWRETMVSVQGAIVADMQQMFAHSWLTVTGEALTPCDRGVPGGGMIPVRLQCMRGILHQDLKREAIRMVKTAQRRAWLSTAYFVPSRKLRRALVRAARRSVDVRLLLPGALTDHPAVRQVGHRYYTRLLRAGVRIFEYTPRNLHSKALLCDNLSSIGSSNFDQWTSFWNLEANLLVADEEFAHHVNAMFEADLAVSEEIHLRLWLARPWWLRWQEVFWGWVRQWSLRLQRGRIKE